jgi:cell division protease FtsH
MEEKTKKIVKMRYIVLLILPVIFLIAFNYAKDTAATKAITYNDFINLLEKNQISKVLITNENLLITTSENNEEYKGKTLYTAKIDDDNLVSKLLEANVKFEGKNAQNNGITDILISWIFPLAILFFIWKYIRLLKQNKYLIAQIKELTEKNDNYNRDHEKSEK